ncbi:MAG: twin-arginine translocase TatA/TatE family subunit [Actinomycetota bacterium]|nr:twin-arginine translocase TatA/TatE family subunit [Actinomycetota bacterium]
MLAEILGLDSLVVVGIIVLVIGASRLPKIARSVGQAKGEFEKGLKEGTTANETGVEKKDQ